MSTNLKLGSFALLFTTSLLGTPAAMAGDAGLGDGQDQARRLFAGPHHSSVDPAPVPTPRIAKAPTADAHEHAQGLFQPKFATNSGASPFEGAVLEMAGPELEGHEQARRLLQR
jgi:hypothetical protein